LGDYSSEILETPVMDRECPFCALESYEIVARNRLAVAIYDKFPASPGHILVIPRRHFADYFDATDEELRAIDQLLRKSRAILLQKRSPDGFNIGINIGAAAGQTVFHLHVHLIPRYVGDHAQPAGGVRHIIPGKGYYPQTTEPGLVKR
jgi:diadenosine tetraphosphate (Ap4A) HIT family hydrolase